MWKNSKHRFACPRTKREVEVDISCKKLVEVQRNIDYLEGQIKLMESLLQHEHELLHKHQAELRTLLRREPDEDLLAMGM